MTCSAELVCVDGETCLTDRDAVSPLCHELVVFHPWPLEGWDVLVGFELDLTLMDDVGVAA